VKTAWAGGRVTANAAGFFIDWNDLQLNLPNPAVPAQFYIANVGEARSAGVELEVTARPQQGLDLFGTFGYTHARFGDGSLSSGVDVSGNELPSTPAYTATLGAGRSWTFGGGASLYGRAEAVWYGAFQYDDANTAGQEAYALAQFRAGVRVGRLFGEAWVRNAFDARYVPVAFAYGGFAPSGFVGESGAPRTFGFAGGVAF
jgi:iron complex outermembrane receptor protein